jgi:hypothetical protein
MPSALLQAIEQGDLQAVLTALEHEANLEEADIHRAPGLPLRSACFHGHLEIVRELIRRGANIDAPNGDGSGGPIRAAVRGKHPAIIDLLVAHGAQIPPDLPLPSPESGERRQRGERRRQHGSPPAGLRDRRAEPERRATSVQEIALSEGQWEHYFTQSQPMRLERAIPGGIDEAAMVLARVRD